MLPNLFLRFKNWLTIDSKMSEMLKVSEVFKSNFNYYQREEDFLEFHVLH